MVKPNITRATKLMIFRIYSLAIFFVMLVGAIIDKPAITIWMAIFYGASIMITELTKWIILKANAKIAKDKEEAKSTEAAKKTK